MRAQNNNGTAASNEPRKVTKNRADLDSFSEFFLSCLKLVYVRFLFDSHSINFLRSGHRMFGFYQKNILRSCCFRSFVIPSHASE